MRDGYCINESKVFLKKVFLLVILILISATELPSIDVKRNESLAAVISIPQKENLSVGDGTFIVPYGNSIPREMLDGEFGPEWNDANFLSDLQMHDASNPSVEFNTKIFIKHDGERIYIAVEIEDSVDWEALWTFFMLDANGDRSVLTPLDDYVVAAAVTGGVVPEVEDYHRFGQGLRSDLEGGGTRNTWGGGQVVRSADTFIYRMELSQPLNSGDQFDVAWNVETRSSGIHTSSRSNVFQGPDIFHFLVGGVALDNTNGRGLTFKCCDPENAQGIAFEMEQFPSINVVDGLLEITTNEPVEISCTFNSVSVKIGEEAASIEQTCTGITDLRIQAEDENGQGLDIKITGDGIDNIESIQIFGSNNQDDVEIKGIFSRSIVPIDSNEEPELPKDFLLIRSLDDNDNIHIDIDMMPKCLPCLPGTYRPVGGSKFSIDTGDGNDSVDLDADIDSRCIECPPGTFQSESPEIELDTGAGNDKVELKVTYLDICVECDPESPPAPDPYLPRISVNLDAGDDELTDESMLKLFSRNSETNPNRFEDGIEIVIPDSTWELGEGNDKVTIKVPGSAVNASIPPEFIQAEFQRMVNDLEATRGSFEVSGGPGNDQFLIEKLHIPLPLLRFVNFQGGPGDDLFNIRDSSGTNPDGGEGVDILNLDIPKPFVSATIDPSTIFPPVSTWTNIENLKTNFFSLFDLPAGQEPNIIEPDARFEGTAPEVHPFTGELRPQLQLPNENGATGQPRFEMEFSNEGGLKTDGELRSESNEKVHFSFVWTSEISDASGDIDCPTTIKFAGRVRFTDTGS